mmetsp:Transcript_53895/g.63027  ORF Transcript_53895/g.63027 Transcript_53895/m.63027 type:complete len:98 (-) Transcript_53895:215-508(-)
MIPTASNITAIKHKKEHVPNTCSLEGILLSLCKSKSQRYLIVHSRTWSADSHLEDRSKLLSQGCCLRFFLIRIYLYLGVFSPHEASFVDYLTDFHYV